MYYRFILLFILMIISLSEAKEVRRFAIAAGANFGGKERMPLRYATTDAESFLNVVNQLGGVAEGDKILLKEPTKDEFIGALNEVKKRVSALIQNQEKTEVIVYYSGHANEQGLLLGEEHLGYKELRGQVNDLGSDVKIAVLDACASGSITRFKGGVRREAFLVDESTNMKGYAFITSSSGNEVSQESDKISGSFFTHYLVTGLRGAADISGDGKVTLSEAYQFAFNETLANTEKTDGGAQHANYDMKLTGTGDVVFTDVRQISSGLLLSEKISGKMYVRNSEGYLIAELHKQGGRSIELGIGAGVYSINLESGGALKTTTVAIAEGKRVVVNGRDFKQAIRESTVSRGEAGNNNLELDSKGIPRFHEPRTTDFKMFYNEKESPFNGTMLSLGVSNSMRSTSESQISALGNLNNGYIGGVQISGFFNVADNIEYFQGAGVINIAKNVDGAQVAGDINIADTVNGVQFSGLVNSAGDVSGYQVGGLVNVADNVAGSQVSGLVNVGDTITGVQIGFINISDSCDYPIGLISYSATGIFEAGVHYDELGMLNAILRIGGRKTHSILMIGTGLRDTNTKIGLGLGFRTAGMLVFGESDVVSSVIATDEGRDANFIQTLTARLGAQLSDEISITMGASYNVLFVEADRAPLVNPWKMNQIYDSQAHKDVYHWVGYSVGMTLRL